MSHRMTATIAAGPGIWSAFDVDEYVGFGGRGEGNIL